MAGKKNKYIDQEIEWLEAKLLDLKGFIDARPFSMLADRFEPVANKAGNKKLISSIEQQRQDLTKAMAEYAQLLEAIDRLKSEEEKKKLLIRGDDELTPFEERADAEINE